MPMVVTQFLLPTSFRETLTGALKLGNERDQQLDIAVIPPPFAHGAKGYTNTDPNSLES